jgi:hypothetical protein
MSEWRWIKLRFMIREVKKVFVESVRLCRLVERARSDLVEGLRLDIVVRLRFARLAAVERLRFVRLASLERLRFDVVDSPGAERVRFSCLG